MRVCEREGCDNEFKEWAVGTSREKRFCCKKCAHQQWIEDNREHYRLTNHLRFKKNYIPIPPPPLKPCAWCEKEFQPANNNRRYRFCSKDCKILGQYWENVEYHHRRGVLYRKENKDKINERGRNYVREKRLDPEFVYNETLRKRRRDNYSMHPKTHAKHMMRILKAGGTLG
jgi:endogenous inhibitor of DNA gyrase (YacG/DUF329 family)